MEAKLSALPAAAAGVFTLAGTALSATGRSFGPPTTIGVDDGCGSGVAARRGAGVDDGFIAGIVLVTTTRLRVFSTADGCC
jgi:hypothetical protein